MYRWDFYAVFRDLDLLLLGLVNTLKVTSLSLTFGLALGLALALMRLSRRRTVSLPATLVIEMFRATPPLVQLYWFFFALPILLNVSLSPFAASVATFSIQSSAFFAEVFRAGIESIARGQWDAAKALGMSHQQQMRRIVLPQAVKRMIPAFLERSIELLKTTTLVSTVAYADLLFQANDLAQKTFRPLEVYTVAALMYFLMIYPISLIVRSIERLLARSGEASAH